MRILTVRQPWAWALIHGGKDIENRSRNLAGSYRGPVAIHASLTVDRAALEDPRINEAWLDAYGWEPAIDGAFETGVVEGIVDLTGVHHASSCVTVTEEGHCSPWAEPDVHHLEVENPVSLGWMPSRIRARGRLGLWRPDEQLQAQINEGLEVLARIKAGAR